MKTITQILENINMLNSHIFEINENIGSRNTLERNLAENED